MNFGTNFARAFHIDLGNLLDDGVQFYTSGLTYPSGIYERFIQLQELYSQRR